jgi:hypothetical protein
LLIKAGRLPRKIQHFPRGSHHQAAWEPLRQAKWSILGRKGTLKEERGKEEVFRARGRVAGFLWSSGTVWQWN